MSTTIDLENAKSIRQPMEVCVSLEYNGTQALTVSYRTYTDRDRIVVANYAGIQSEYTMRALADLQGDGFPLDGSCVVYDSSTTESAANGKVGVRSNSQGNTFTLTISSATTIPSLTIDVANCSTVTNYNTGDEYDASNGYAIIPVNSTTIDLTFDFIDTSRRVEIRSIIPAVRVSFTNSDLISVELSLRSDLSPIDPSLPESEIEVHAYSETDMSEIIKFIPNDQPITYYAGYDGDYSTVRRFYISEPAQYQNKELILKGVDAVRFLDQDCGNLFVGKFNYATYSSGARTIRLYSQQNGVFKQLCALMVYLVQSAGVEFQSIETFPTYLSEQEVAGKYRASYIENQPIRDVVANLMNLVRQEYPVSWFHDSNWMESITEFYLTYVDAGIPTFTWSKPTAKWDIYEADCGDVIDNIARDIVRIEADNKLVQVFPFDEQKLTNNNDKLKGVQEVGSAEILKDEGAAISINNMPTCICTVRVSGDTNSANATMYVDTADGPLYSPIKMSAVINGVGTHACYKCFDDSYWMEWVSSVPHFWDLAENIGAIESTDSQLNCEVYGNGFKFTDAHNVYTKSGVGVTEYPSTTNWIGVWDAERYDTGTRVRLLPSKGFEALMNRSSTTGSFTWKGDPRMQPRDVFTFHKLDGTTELRTIESISLTHEHGGTVAEITWRKGVV